MLESYLMQIFRKEISSRAQLVRGGHRAKDRDLGELFDNFKKVS